MPYSMSSANLIKDDNTNDVPQIHGPRARYRLMSHDNLVAGVPSC